MDRQTGQVPHVYILASQKRGTLYIGVTSDIMRRVAEHRDAIRTGFTQRYGVKRLVLIEEAPDMASAIAREKQLKNWRRDWKINLIEDTNPEWRDLAIDIGLEPPGRIANGGCSTMDPETSSG